MLSPRFKSKIQHLVLTLADKNGVRIREYANSGNHLHLLVQAKTREGFQKFLRTLTGLIARLITGAKKGNPQGRFWDHLAFSRIVQWGRAFTIARAYVQRNFFEAEELIPYQSRKSTHLAQVLRPARP